MKYFIFTILILLNLSCTSNNQENIIHSSTNKTPTFKKPTYPKIIYVNNDNVHNSESFTVYLGSDNHEYVSHIESHISNQWTHYADCILCKQRYDTLLFYTKLKK